MKNETFKSKAAMKKHEKGEGKNKVAMEKKMGEKDKVSKKSYKKR